MKQAADALETRGFGRDVANAGLFFRRWLANPMQMGSIVPSSPALCRRIAAQTHYGPDEIVLELGGGTGVVSQALLRAGLPADRLYIVEIVHDMAEHLRETVPGAHVIEGDARFLPDLVPTEFQGKIGTVVVGIPLLLVPVAQQRRFVDAILAVAPGRSFILFTYWLASPIAHEKLGLTAKREAWTAMNFPPASVWRYSPK